MHIAQFRTKTTSMKENHHQQPNEGESISSVNDDHQVASLPSRSNNPYALYVHEELSPRSSGWLYLFSVSIACLSSFLLHKQEIDTTREYIGLQSWSSVYELVVILLSTSSCISLLIVLFYQHRYMRDMMTKCKIVGRYFRYSPEIFLSVVTFIIWCIILRYLTSDPASAAIVDGETKSWNVNIWVCAWLGFGLASYLMGELITASSSKMCGVRVRRDYVRMLVRDAYRSTPPVREEEEDDESSAEYWFMLLTFSSCVAAFSITSQEILGSAIGLFCTLQAFTILVLCRLNEMGLFEHLSSSKGIILSRIDAALSVSSMILHSINLGFGTEISGPSTEMNNNMYVSSSMGVLLSLILCERARKRFVERLILPSPTPYGSQFVDMSDISIAKNGDNLDTFGDEGVLISPKFEKRKSSGVESNLSPTSQYLTVDASHEQIIPHCNTKPSLSMLNELANDGVSFDDGDSAVMLNFQPQDDMSSIGESMMTKVTLQAGAEPDGYVFTPENSI